MVHVIGLTWDDSNIDHIANHKVSRQEVEEVCFSRHYSRRVLGRRHRRYMVIGQSEEGRYLTVFLDFQKGGIFHPVTARDAEEHERRLFQNER